MQKKKTPTDWAVFNSHFDDDGNHVSEDSFNPLRKDEQERMDKMDRIMKARGGLDGEQSMKEYQEYMKRKQQTLFWRYEQKHITKEDKRVLPEMGYTVDGERLDGDYIGGGGKKRRGDRRE